MSVFEQRFYTINRRLLSLVGLWPYGERRDTFFHGFLTQIGLYIGIVIQMMRLIISRYNGELVLEIVSYVINAVVVTILHFIIYIEKDRKQIELFDSIDNDWLIPEKMEEHEILRKFGEETRTFMIAFLSLTYLHVGLVVPTSTYPLILDVINPLNKTRQTKFIPLLEYFSGRERCILKILPIYYLAMIWLGITATATCGLIIMSVQHVCSLFALTGYLMTHAMDDEGTTNDICKDRKMYENIVRATKCHKRALLFLDRFNTFFEMPNLFMYALMVALITFEIVQINKIDVKRASLMAIQATIVCALSMSGQKVIDYSNGIYESVIMTRWYLASVKTQKLLLLIIMRSIRPSYVWIGGLFISSNEFCLCLIRNSVSYATVLYSLQ